MATGTTKARQQTKQNPSEGVARVVQSASNRAVPALGKGKAAAKLASGEIPADRRAVYKSALDNPFRVNWPNVPLNIQNSVLACLIELVNSSNLSAYHVHRETSSRRKRKQKRQETQTVQTQSDAQAVAPTLDDAFGSKRKRNSTGGSPARKKRKDDAGAVAAIEVPEPAVEPSIPDEVPRPPILDHLKIGINEVTKRLEADTLFRRNGHHLITAVELIPTSDMNPVSSTLPETVTPRPQQPHSQLRLVFVCRSDVDPPMLINHFPMLVAALNSSTKLSQELEDVLLIPLPKGAEHALAEAVGLRRVAVLAVDASMPDFNRLCPFLEAIPLLSAPWLRPPQTGALATYIPTQIKQLRTTAPKDMKAAKEARSKGKAEAKLREKARVEQASLEVEGGASAVEMKGKKRRWGRKRARQDAGVQPDQASEGVQGDATAEVPPGPTIGKVVPASAMIES